MELTIKNDDLGAIIGKVLAEGENEPVFEGRTPEQNGQYMVVTYAMDILRNGLSLGKELQFAYKDLIDLPAAAAACYRAYRQRESVTYSAQGTAKSLARVLLCPGVERTGPSLRGTDETRADEPGEGTGFRQLDQFHDTLERGGLPSSHKRWDADHQS